MKLYYDRDGNEIDIKERAELFEKDRVVWYDELLNWYCVSTVYIGLNHNFYWGQPLIFETMVFQIDENGERSDESYDMDRHADHELAIKWHADMVAKRAEMEMV